MAIVTSEKEAFDIFQYILSQNENTLLDFIVYRAYLLHLKIPMILLNTYYEVQVQR